jgi:hypothetical protein
VVDPPEFTASDLDASAPAAPDTVYTFSLSFDESTNVFTWFVAGGAFGPGVFGTGNVSAFAASVGMQMNTVGNGFSAAQLLARTSDHSGGGDGAITVGFDDVLVATNGADPAVALALHDDFATMGSSEATGFNPARWTPANGGATLSGGTLHLVSAATTADTSPTSQVTGMSAMYPARFNAWQADLAILSDSQAGTAGSSNSVQLNGAYYNAGGGGPNDATGDVRALLQLRTGNVTYTILKCQSASCGGAVAILASGALTPSPTHPLGLGTVHTLLQRWDPSTRRFTFRIDDAPPVQVDPTVAAPVVVATPFVPVKSIASGVSIAPGIAGSSARIEATVNNVHGTP